MGLFNFGKRKEEIIETIDYTINELKNKVTTELKLLEELKMIDEVNKLNKAVNGVSDCINELSKINAESNYNKSVIIGVNNLRRSLCNTLAPLAINRNPKKMTEFNDYLIEINKLINNSHNNLSKFGKGVSIIYKEGMSNLINNLNILNDCFNNCNNQVKKIIEKINSLKEIQSLFNDYESIKNESIELKNELTNKKNKSLIIDKKIIELKNNLESLKNSDKIKKAESDIIRIKSLSDELDKFKSRINLLVSYLSRSIKKLIHESGFKTADKLISEPVEFINSNQEEFDKIKKMIISDDKQELKAKQVLESDELNKLVNEYLRISNEINILDTSELDKINEIEKEIKEESDYKIAINNDINSINNNLAISEDKINNLIKKLIITSEEFFKINIKIKN